MSASVVLLIVGFLAWKAWPAATDIGLSHFLLRTGRGRRPPGGFSLVAMAASTAAVTLGAVALAGPLGVASALFSRYYAPRAVAGVYRRGSGAVGRAFRRWYSASGGW